MTYKTKKKIEELDYEFTMYAPTGFDSIDLSNYRTEKKLDTIVEKINEIIERLNEKH